MITVTVTFDLLILFLVVLNAIGLVTYWVILKRRSTRAKREVDKVSAFVKQFFHENGGDVNFECLRKPDGSGLTVLVDATTSRKRFRHSHLAELILVDYVRQKCKVELQKVYWRFPLKAPPDESMLEDPKEQAEHMAEDIDEYLREGLLRMRDLPVYEVNETSLEQFHEHTRKKQGRA